MFDFVWVRIESGELKSKQNPAELLLSGSQGSLVAGARNHLNLHFLSTCLRVLEQMAAGNHGDLFRTAA